jgi:hypothetical protein
MKAPDLSPRRAGGMSAMPARAADFCAVQQLEVSASSGLCAHTPGRERPSIALLILPGTVAANRNFLARQDKTN